MKLKLLLNCFLLLTIQSFAQDSSFQLKDYKYRTQGFKALELAFDGSSFISNLKIQDITKTNANTRGFNLNLSHLGYYRFKSTEKKVHSSYFTLIPGLYSNFTETNGKVKKASTFQNDFLWDRNDRYYKSNQWFFELGNFLSNQWQSSQNKDTNVNTQDNKLKLEDQVTLGFGKGRVERVQDAQMALYILKDLQEQGLLNGPIQPAVTQNFAKLITDINNKRVFDFRRKRIYELTQIDSFLRNSGLVNTTDIRHFTIINDNWALANNPGRFSGSDWYVRIQPSAAFEKNTSNANWTALTTTALNTTKKLTLSPVIGFERFVPINLKWQKNMAISASWLTEWYNSHSKVTNNGIENQTDNETKSSQAHLYTYYSMGYYPNNRTALNAGLQLEANYTKFNNDLFYKSSTRITPTFSISTHYFINYRTSLNAQWSVLYDKIFTKRTTGEQQENHYFQTGFSLSLSHLIF
jgi:hypothetical protein